MSILLIKDLLCEYSSSKTEENNGKITTMSWASLKTNTKWNDPGPNIRLEFDDKTSNLFQWGKKYKIIVEELKE